MRESRAHNNGSGHWLSAGCRRDAVKANYNLSEAEWNCRWSCKAPKNKGRWITRCSTNFKTVKLIKTRELRKARHKSAVGALSLQYIPIHLRRFGSEGAYVLNSWSSKTPLISLALMGKFCRQISNFRRGCFRNAISMSAFSMQRTRKAPPGESFVAKPRKAVKYPPQAAVCEAADEVAVDESFCG